MIFFIDIFLENFQNQFKYEPLDVDLQTILKN